MKIVTITPHRNRLPQLDNHIRSIAYQTRRPDQVIVSSHGDTEETRREIVDILGRRIDSVGVPKQFWAMGKPSDPWRKPLAINWAIRRTPGDVDVIVTLDVDCILHSQVLEQVELAFEEDFDRYVMCPNLSLGKKADLDNDDWTYGDLRPKGHFLTWHGAREGMGPISMSWGCMQAAKRDWWFKVRGLDEEMQYWGSEDYDLAKRANATGLKWHWIPKNFALLHQWHPPGQQGAGLDLDPEVRTWLKKNHRISSRKLRRKEFVRNPNGWGGMED